MEKLLKVLTIIAVGLACIILTLLFVLFVRMKQANGLSSTESKFERSGKKIAEIKPALFSDIGTLRAKTKDGVTLVIAVYFEYNKNDIPFQEELVKKKALFREVILHYFSEQKASEIKKTGEDAIKKNILRAINSELTLNKIETIYFEKFVILE